MPVTGSQLLQFSGVNKNKTATTSAVPAPRGITGTQLIQFATNRPTVKPVARVAAPITAPQLPQNNNNNILAQAGNAFNQVLKTSNELTNRVKDVPVLGGVAQAGNALVQGIPQVPDYTKAAVQHPAATVAGAGAAVVDFGVKTADLGIKVFKKGTVPGMVLEGVEKALNYKTPERLDILKQNQAFQEGIKSIAKSRGVDEERALDTGKFIGAMIPYSLGGEVVGATLGAKALTPLATKFLPQATKFIPAINDAVAVMGVGQITHDDANGSRIDQLKNDLTMLALFKVVDFAVGKTKVVFSPGTKVKVEEVVDTYSSKFKAKQDIPLEEVEHSVFAAKQAILLDTGKKPETIIATTINELTGLPEFKKVQSNTPTNYQTVDDNGRIILTPFKKESDILNTYGKEEATKAQILKEGQGIKNGQSEGGQSSQSQLNPTVQKTGEVLNPVGQGNPKESRLYDRVKDTIEEEYRNKNVTYNTLSLEKQAKDVTDLVEKEPARAYKIAKGLEKTPEGVTQNAVSLAVAESAKAAGDFRTYSDIMTSTSLRSTRLGQEIVSLRGSFADGSTENAVRQVIKSRMEKVAEAYQSSIADRIKEVAKLSPHSTPEAKAQAVISKQAERLKQALNIDQVKIRKAQDIIDALKCK